MVNVSACQTSHTEPPMAHVQPRKLNATLIKENRNQRQPSSVDPARRYKTPAHNRRQNGSDGIQAANIDCRRLGTRNCRYGVPGSQH